MPPMNVLSLTDLALSVDDRVLFSDVSLGLDEGGHVGVVGRNGSGKTSLLDVIAGRRVPDNGHVSIKSGLEVGYLSQRISYEEGSSVEDFLYQAPCRATQVLHAYNQAIERGDDKDYERLLAIIEKEDSWSVRTSYAAWLDRLGLPSSILTRSMASLSGGEQRKAAIARLFALKPDIMLLDEPTNHLDIRTVEALEDEIGSTSASVIMVTHDRYILEEVCDMIWEVEDGRIYRHPGSFDVYLSRRAERHAMLQKEQDRMASILRRELVWLSRAPKARTGKDKNRKERIESMLGQVRDVSEKPQTAFSSLERRLGKSILEINDVGAAYDGRWLFKGFNYEFKKGDRIGVIGDNGSGKSTLLDLVAGSREPDAGSIERGVNTFIGYHDQLSRTLPPSKSTLDFISDIGTRILFAGNEVSPERLLELFGFARPRQRLPISVLSGGEKRRLQLVSVLVTNPNFLVLDEPTNDLDIATIENLEDYLASFPGCVLTVSHDRAFLDVTCTSLFLIKDGAVHNLPTTYSSWKKEEAAATKEQAPSQKPRQDTRQREAKKGLSWKEQRELESLETEIEELEEEKAQLETSFSDSSPSALATLPERTRRYEEVSRLIDEKSGRYFSLAERM